MHLPLSLMLAVVALAVRAAEDVCQDGQCGDRTDDEGAVKYSRTKNEPKVSVASRVAKLQTALMNLMKNPYDKNVLRSSLVELAEFSETTEGKRFLEKFSEMLEGGSNAGAAGSMVKQIFSAILSGSVDLGDLMKNGLTASNMAKLASGVLKREDSSNSAKIEDILPLLKTFLQIIKEEQSSPFLIEKLTEAFQESMSKEQLRNFEKSAAGVLSSIASARDEVDNDFEYDTTALESFENYLKDTIGEHGWDWAANKHVFQRELKRVMRMFPGSEDQIGRHLPAIMEIILDDKPTKLHRSQIIDNFGGILGLAVKKDKSDPEFILQLTDRLRKPIKESVKESIKKESVKGNINEDSTKTDDRIVENETNELDQSSEEILPDISKLAESVSKLTSNPEQLQQMVSQIMSKGKDINMKDLESIIPELEGMDKVKAYLDQVQKSGDEKELAEHFHKLMDVVGDSFDILNSREIRLEAIGQIMPYIRMAHDFLKEPMALFKIQMGIMYLTSMYQVSVDDLVEQATPYVDDSLSTFGIKMNLKTFVADAKKFLLDTYHKIYQSSDSAVKKLSSAQIDEYILDSADHLLAEPVVMVFDGYKSIRQSPDCILRTLCTVNREVRSTDRGQLGIRPAVAQFFSRLFGMLLVTSQHGIDSPVHDQIGEALDEAAAEGRCETRYPDCTGENQW